MTLKINSYSNSYSTCWKMKLPTTPGYNREGVEKAWKHADNPKITDAYDPTEGENDMIRHFFQPMP